MNMRNSKKEILLMINSISNPMKDQNWYVSTNVQQDDDTMLFTKRVKNENLKIDKDRTIAHVEGLTLEEAEANAKLIATAPSMLEVLNWINIKYGDLEGDRELSPYEFNMLSKVREVLSLVN